MKLTVGDRFALLNLLPAQGDFSTLKVVRELREELSFFTVEESEKLEFKAEGENIQWSSDPAADPMKDFEFTKAQERVITDALEKAEKSKKLSLAILPLYEQFMADDLRAGS